MGEKEGLKQESLRSPRKNWQEPELWLHKPYSGEDHRGREHPRGDHNERERQLSRRLRRVQGVMTTVSFCSPHTVCLTTTTHIHTLRHIHYVTSLPDRVDFQGVQTQAWALTCCRFSMFLRIHAWR